MKKLLLLAVVAASAWSCTNTQAVSPQDVQDKYGVSGAFTDSVQTPDGNLPGTVVPVTLPDGRKAQLIVPKDQKKEPHPLYLRDNEGLHPVEVDRRASRNQVVESPQVVARQPEPNHPNKRSWEKDALIIGGAAGGGAGIGAIAGGKKGAGIGAAAGGIGGLIYDIATRNKDQNQ